MESNMADNSIVQTIKDAEIDARSLSEFIYKPAGYVVNRRLASPIHTLDYYISVMMDAVKNTGFVVVGNFTDGAVVDKRTDAVRHSDGGVYRWGGSLPKTVPSGSTPESSGGFGINAWVEVGGAKLSQDLLRRPFINDYDVIGDYSTSPSITSHTQAVAYTGSGRVSLYKVSSGRGLPYQTMPSTYPNPSDDPNLEVIRSATVEDLASKLGTDMTIIRNDVLSIPAKMTMRGQNTKVLITGASTVFNGYGYPSSWGVSGAAYSTDLPFGMSSWSHLMRDYWFAAHPDFVGIDRLDIDTDAEVMPPLDVSGLGMNSKAVLYKFTDDNQKLTIKNKSPYPRNLVLSYASSAFYSSESSFSVNGETHTNTAPNNNYKGRGYLLIPIAANSDITVSNVNTIAPSASAGGYLYVYGVTGETSSTFDIAAKGAYGVSQIMAEYNTLVKPYSPDVVIFYIGGNDSSGTPISLFKQSIRDFINNVRSDKPNATIIIMGTTPSAAISSDVLFKYNRAARQVCDEYKASFIDVMAKLGSLDPAYYRHDTIHFNKAGDTIMFNIIKSLLFPTVNVDKSVFNPVRDNNIGATLDYYYEKRLRRETILASVRCKEGAPAVNNIAGSGITAAYNSDATKLLVTAPQGYSFASLTPAFVEPDGADIRYDQLQDDATVVIGAYDSNGAATSIVREWMFIRIIFVLVN